MKSLYMIILAATVLVSCGGRGGNNKHQAAARQEPVVIQSETTSGIVTPKEYGYEIVKVLPHSVDSYTQGLFWHDGHFYEGTGIKGRSALLKVNPSTGEAAKTLPLDKRYFGEGVTWHDGKIYQLTWEEGKAFVYDAETFRLIKTFSYDGEGWGITSDGTKLYMSDGSDKITVRNPDTFAVERILSVRRGSSPVRELNELEWIDGEIWANVYTYEEVVKIDPQTGAVTGIIDFEGIQSPSDYVRGQTDFFNGIAYDEKTGNIYVTGKNWNKLYQVEVFEK